jgi:GAF domain-containing protein
MSVPVLDAGELVGVLTVYSPYAFREQDQMLIQSLARELPTALRSSDAARAAQGSGRAQSNVIHFQRNSA